MAFPNDKRAVSYDPAARLHLVSKKVSRGERNLPDRALQCGDAPAQIDSLCCIPPAILPEGANVKAISPDKANVKFIEKINKAIHPAREVHSVATVHSMQAIYPAQAILASREKLLSPDELHQLYDGTSVPAHRYLAGLLSTAVNSPEIVPDPAKWLAGISEVNLSGVVEAWLSTRGSTEYEQLNSIGLDAHTSRLTGVVRVKQRSGYLGGPSTAGSREYVAFWVDWGSGFHYEGTTSVAVHDFSSLPAAGLEYKVFLPVDVRSHAQPGSKGAKKVKVRAVLSWNTPPPATDSGAPVVWGNSLDGVILIPPGINVSSGARFSLKQAPAGYCLRAMS
jgi:hypothetical protein